MNVVVRLGEPFWRTVGEREVELDLPEGATVAEAIRVLGERHPALAPELGGELLPAIFFEESEARGDSPLKPGDRLHVVWPVSGG